jgi:hypothetical protein
MSDPNEDAQRMCRIVEQDVIKNGINANNAQAVKDCSTVCKTTTNGGSHGGQLSGTVNGQNAQGTISVPLFSNPSTTEKIGRGVAACSDKNNDNGFGGYPYSGSGVGNKTPLLTPKSPSTGLPEIGH